MHGGEGDVVSDGGDVAVAAVAVKAVHHGQIVGPRIWPIHFYLKCAMLKSIKMIMTINDTGPTPLRLLLF